MKISTRRLVALLPLLVPVGIEAQCGIDLIESGVRAYRELELETAKQLLSSAVELNGSASSPCWTENARALTYLGASHWLDEQPDSAARAFRLAVIQAPRFRPDDVEFPPELTTLFDVVRRRTPAVAATLPEEILIGADAEDALPIRLTASTGHRVTVTLRSPEGRPVRELYTGPIDERTAGQVVEWDGRDGAGQAVASGPYEVDIVSEDSLSRPQRKVVIPLAVTVDAPPAPVLAERPRPAPPPAAVSTQAARSPDRRNVPGGLALGGLGLGGGALVVGLPYLVDSPGPTWARYSIAGGLALAGIIGLFRGLSGDDPAPPPPVLLEPPPVQQPVTQAPFATERPTIRITSGHQRRIEVTK